MGAPAVQACPKGQAPDAAKENEAHTGGSRKSERLIRPKKRGNSPHGDPAEEREAPCQRTEEGKMLGM